MATDSIALPRQVKDIAGKSFGRVTALHYVGSNLRGSEGAYWDCVCECGTKMPSTFGGDLRRGRVKSCGCLLKDSAKAAGLKKVKDEIGNKYGKLTVVKALGKKYEKGRSHYWGCDCDCGGYTEASGSNLRSGLVSSCGCVFQDGTTTTHGESRLGKVTREYRIWRDMISRCTNPKRNNYHLYGGRGITVCDRWRNSYEAFLEDMGRAPSKKHTLDRNENDKGYSPGNCSWETMSRQARNRRSTRMLTFQGRTMAASDWADELDIPLSRILGRLKNGWSVEKALTAPKLKSNGATA
jgi:hypothetical protein